MKEEESTHTHTTNEILLGASVSDHPQNFATKEENLSPTHWQTPANFSFAPLVSRRLGQRLELWKRVFSVTLYLALRYFF